MLVSNLKKVERVQMMDWVYSHEVRCTNGKVNDYGAYLEINYLLINDSEDKCSQETVDLELPNPISIDMVQELVNKKTKEL